MGAYGLDLFLVLVGGALLSSEFEKLAEDLFSLDLYGSDYWIYLLYVFYLLYFFFFEGIFSNSSLGKKVVGICIASKNLTWWRVLISYSIDGVILPLSFFIAFSTQPMWTSGDAVGDGMTAVLTPFIVFAFYFIILESLSGKTLGKKLMGLQVVQTVPQAAPGTQEEKTK